MQKDNEKKKKGESTMTGKYLDPKADLTFKLVFGEHKDLTMSLLNALLPLADDEQITSLEYVTPEMVPENPGKKDSVVDVRCTDAKGRQFIVEMQMYWNRNFQQRVIINASKAVVKQLDEGEDFSLVQPVYCLNLVNDIGFKSALDEFYHDYAIVNVAHSDRIIEGLRFIFIELPKFKPQSIAEKKMAVLWLRFLTEINRKTKEAPAELLENEDTRKALSIVEKSAMTEGQLYAYDKFWMAVADEAGRMEERYHRGLEEGLEKGIKEGIKEGIEKGLEKGRAEGLERGRVEGRAEGRSEASLETARKMKADGMDLPFIMRYTGLSKDEIEAL